MGMECRKRLRDLDADKKQARASSGICQNNNFYVLDNL
jgi:hypothetical protein